MAWQTTAGPGRWAPYLLLLPALCWATLALAGLRVDIRIDGIEGALLDNALAYLRLEARTVGRPEQADLVVALRARIWLDPWSTANSDAYQIVQSLQAIAAGGVFGQGIGQGAPTLIPVVHSDFAFAALAEEWGFVGCLVVLALFFALLALGLRVAMQAKERFGAVLATGIVCALFLQLVVNLGGVLGLLPVTGVTLPLMSYGGSSVVTVHLMIGLLLNISMRRYMF